MPTPLWSWSNRLQRLLEETGPPLLRNRGTLSRRADHRLTWADAIPLDTFHLLAVRRPADAGIVRRRCDARNRCAVPFVSTHDSRNSDQKWEDGRSHPGLPLGQHRRHTRRATRAADAASTHPARLRSKRLTPGTLKSYFRPPRRF